MNRTVNTSRQAIRERTSNPAPIPIPNAAATQIIAAVVMPLTLVSPLKITPAPTKPIPTTTLAAILSGVPFPPISSDSMVKRVAPRQIRVRVRNPADLLRYSLSAPINPPTTTARINFQTKSCITDINNYFYDLGPSRPVGYPFSGFWGAPF